MNKTNDPMASGTSPGQVIKKTGVRRVNNMPIYLVCAGVAVFLVIMALVAAGRANKQDLSVGEEKKGNTNQFASAIVGDNDGLVEGPPIPIARPDGKEAPPTPAAPSEDDALAKRLQAMKMQQLQQAIAAKTTVPNTMMKGAGGQSAGGQPNDDLLQAAALAGYQTAQKEQAEAASKANPEASFSSALAALQGGGNGGSGGDGAARRPNNDVKQFAGTAGNDRWKLDSKLDAPRTPYELRAGFVIPALLISGINSELPGQIMGQVSQDVYDTATGKYKLIPQGSRLVGSYSSDVAYGQSRVLVAWQRIVFPDGKAMDIGAMPGADGGGVAGLGDQVNNHYFRIFSSAILMSAVTAGATLSQPNTSAFAAPSAGTTLSAALGQQLGQVTAAMIQKNLNISPTLEIRPGFRFNVMVTKDLTFTKPYKAFDY